MVSDPWCPLLALPAELRNNIWEEVFEGNEVQISTTHGSDKGSAAPALLFTCKLIYSEATSVYYALSDFQAVTLSYHRLADRLVCLPKSSFNLIQRISIHLIHHPNSYIEPEVWASRAQENVLRMRKKLIASSHPDAHCVKIRTVVYDTVGSKYWTSTPWETFVALINAPSVYPDRQYDNSVHDSALLAWQCNFFKLDHEDPVFCWCYAWDWQQKQKCSCKERHM